MKKRIATCPDCKSVVMFHNWFHWTLYTPFHWFGKRRMKCPYCGKRAYVRGVKVY